MSATCEAPIIKYICERVRLMKDWVGLANIRVSESKKRLGSAIGKSIVFSVAGNHGRAVGKTISGSPQPFLKVLVFWSAHTYSAYGKGDLGEIVKFIAYYANQGRIVAVSCMQNDPVVSKVSELFRLELMPTPEEVKAGKDLLSIDISSSNTVSKVES
ncbi:hypothetical protein JOM56_001222 [Amanita muscaria]